MAKAALRVVSEAPMDKQKALDAALGQIERAFGKGSIMKLGAGAAVQVEAIPTGSIGLDVALGIGGIPRGRVVEIYGPESSGKTTLALSCVAEAQKLGGTCAFIDAEHALDPIYAGKLEVNVDELLISQPDAGEQALEITDTLVRSGAIDLVVIDSVAALVPRAELEGEMGDIRPCGRPPGAADEPGAAQAHGLGVARSRHCCVIFINQIRMKIGVMYGSPETTTGGNALKFYALDASVGKAGTACFLRGRWATSGAASARSRTGTRWSATRPGSRWSRADKLARARRCPSAWLRVPDIGHVRRNGRRSRATPRRDDRPHHGALLEALAAVLHDLAWRIEKSGSWAVRSQARRACSSSRRARRLQTRFGCLDRPSGLRCNSSGNSIAAQNAKRPRLRSIFLPTAHSSRRVRSQAQSTAARSAGTRHAMLREVAPRASETLLQRPPRARKTSRCRHRCDDWLVRGTRRTPSSPVHRPRP